MAAKMIKEYGGKEKYSSKSSMMKHEKKESSAMEKREAGMKKGGAVKKSFMDKIGRAVGRKTADVKGRAMKKGA